MGTLFVDKLDPQSGTALEIGSSGDTITIPSGAIITNSGTANGFGLDMTGTAFRAYNDAQQNLSHITWTKANMTNEAYDPGSNYDASNSKYVVPSAGYYQIFFSPFLQASAANNFMAKVYVNGTWDEAAMGSESAVARFETAGYQQYFTMVNSYVAYYDASDYLELYIYIEDNSGTISQGNGRATSFWGGYKLA